MARSWFWGMLFFIQILIKKVLNNWFFQLLARSWFWRMLFSIQMLIKKVLNNWFFQLLARSWFWWMLFLIQFLIKTYWKSDFPPFGKILVLVNAFSTQILIKNSIEKLIFFQLLARFWFWRMLSSYSNSK